MADSYNLEELLKEFSSHRDENQAAEEENSAPSPEPEAVGGAAEQEQELSYYSLPESEYPEYEQDHGYEEYREDFSRDFEEAEPEAPAEEPKQPPKPKKNILTEILMSLAGLVFLAVSVMAIIWVGLNVHPDAGTATTVSGGGRLNVLNNLDSYMNSPISARYTPSTRPPP